MEDLQTATTLTTEQAFTVSSALRSAGSPPCLLLAQCIDNGRAIALACPSVPALVEVVIVAKVNNR